MHKCNKLLSLDIWDTVLRRKCAPDESKLAISKYIFLKYSMFLNDSYSIFDIAAIRKECELNIADENQRVGYDDEYVINDVFIMLMHEIFDQKFIDRIKCDEIAKEWIDVEINHEIYLTYLDEEIFNIINSYKGEYDNLVYISDFYMQKHQIEKILSRFSESIKFKDGFVSCDYLVNKKSGKLFEEVHKALDVAPSNHIHIGDNVQCDVSIPLQLGMKALLHAPVKGSKGKSYNELKYSQRINENIEIYVSDVIKHFDYNSCKNVYCELGMKYSLIFFEYVYNIIEHAIKENIEVIYYFTREGEFFKQIHHAIEKYNPLNINIPKAEILEVSRMATFCPSIQKVTIDELMRLWSQYHDQSMRMFFKSLNINEEKFIHILNIYDIEIDEIFENIYEQDKIIKLFNNNEFIDSLSSEIDEKRNLFKLYMDQKQIYSDTEKIFVVDIGWRGSIQDNIALMYPNTKVIGHYIGLFEPFYQKIENTEKYAMISNRSNEEYLWCLKYVDPIEMLCNSKTGSTIGYVDNNSTIQAIKKNYEEEDSVYFRYTSFFQEGVIETISNWCNMIKTYSIVSDELKIEALKQLEQLVTKPQKELAEAYFNLVHNEDFGKGSIDSKEAKYNVNMLIGGLIKRNYHNEFYNYIENTHWPQGYLVYYNLSFLIKNYNSLLKKSFVEYVNPKLLKFNKIQTLENIDYQYADNRWYIDKVSNDGNIEIEGWALINGISSDNCKILIGLINDKSKYFFDTNIIRRQDVTSHLNDGVNYNKSGFLCKINPNSIEKNSYKICILIVVNNLFYFIDTNQNIKLK